jgi:hypothetical protein
MLRKFGLLVDVYFFFVEAFLVVPFVAFFVALAGCEAMISLHCSRVR